MTITPSLLHTGENIPKAIDYTMLYYICAHKVLTAFAGLSKHDLAIMYILYRYDAPLSMGILQTLIKHDMPQIRNGCFSKRLKRLLGLSYVVRSRVGVNVHYTLSVEGRKMIHWFAEELELMVKNRIESFPAYT